MIDAGRADRCVDILSIDPYQYSNHVVGGDAEFNPITATNPERQAVLGGARYNVFINGGFFNFRQFYPGYPTHAPLGAARTHAVLTHVPIPHGYVDTYHKYSCSDGSFLHSAPLLTKEGQNQFPATQLKQERFRWSGSSMPGGLTHASEPNPRAGISYPDNSSTRQQGRVRLVAVLATDRSATSNGFTLPEFAALLTRVSRMNTPFGHALGLDGGGSVALGLVDHQGEYKFLVAQYDETGRACSTMLSFRFTGV